MIVVKLLLVAFLLAIFYYQCTFTKYNWQNKNKPAAIGAALLAIIGLLLPLFAIFS